jgi:mRNA-degrading endonuclease YafQ of YafQ-DinJ toxin-antitoxin module
MLSIIYAPVFVRQFKKLETALQEEVLEKIKLFQDESNHQSLKMHKLHGEFKACYSFSVNYKTRIVIDYLSKKEVALLAVGDHDLYK